MTPERWQQVKELFHSALEIAPEKRATFLEKECAGHNSLRREVESLLSAHERSGSFINTPAYVAAAEALSEDVAQLSAGARLGSYEVIKSLGRGGMGEVYLAEDERLGRKVALKLLPAAFTQSTERLKRFEREARAASSLNHPNIITIYEIGEEDGKHFIATEFIDGETLRERIRRASLKLEEALDTGLQVASALSAAHDEGIIHRDIKPENIMVRADRLVKVLDFGLVKLDAQEAVDSEAATHAIIKTSSGIIMGTAAYMSPEQARGLSVDARTDIWSLGCVLYEMVTGQSPFAGPTSGDTIVKILEHEPPSLSEAMPDAPVELQRIIRKALRKDREERYQSVKDLLVDLKNLKREPEHTTSPESSPSFFGGMRGRKGIITGALALLITAAIAVGVYKFLQRNSTATMQSKVADATVVLKTTQLTTWPGLDLYPSLSPDGNAVAYVSDHNGAFEIYVKPLTPGARELQLTSDGGQDFQPAWSPDGKFIAYYSKGRGIWVVPASGGTAKQLTEFGGHPAWSPDGSRIAFQSAPGTALDATATGVPGPPAALWIIPSQGGEARPLTQAGNPPGGHGNPSWSPDGKRIVFVVSDASSHIDIWNISADGTGLAQVTNRKNWLYDPIYAPDGEHIYYGGVSDSGSFVLYKLRVAPTNGEAVGEPVEITNTGLARIKNLTISADGKKLAYSAPMMKGNLSSISLSTVSNEATGAPLPITQDSSYRKNRPIFSPDGQKIAYVEFRGGANQDIWVMDTDGKNPTQLTTDPAVDWSPSWFPDNDRVAFESNRQGKKMIWTVSLKSGREKLLVDPGRDLGWPQVSPDGKLISFNSIESGTTNIWVMPVEGGQPVQLTSEKLAGFACWSPDSKFLAFEIAQDDSSQVAIIANNGGMLTQLTFNQGQNWPGGFSPGGDKIVFAGERNGVWNIYWVSRTTREEKQLTNYTKLNSYVRYPTWSPDGKLIVYEHSESAANIWLMELK
ncbi:MAG TPA: protein kinase [Pyrinomonadaceae bacterium]|jgi:Tol biopolymer transport system component/predicted Ser/Thr protein kinase